MKDDYVVTAARWLLVAGRAILVGATLTLVGGFLVSLAGDDTIFAQIQAEVAGDGLMIDGRLIMTFVLGIAAIILVLAERFLARLQAILRSIPDGEPFRLANARHLEVMGWLALAMQGVGAVTTLYSLEAEKVASRLKIESDLSLEGILLILLLFILARVFRHGARLQDDLEGTV